MTQIILFLTFVMGLLSPPLEAVDLRAHCRPNCTPRRGGVVPGTPAVEYGGYYGYGYGYGYNWWLLRSTGVRLDMSLVPKENRKLVDQGVLYVDGAQKGKVDRYNNSRGNPFVRLSPGEHRVRVVIPGGGQFEDTIFLKPGEVTEMVIWFEKFGVPVPKPATNGKKSFTVSPPTPEEDENPPAPLPVEKKKK